MKKCILSMLLAAALCVSLAAPVLAAEPTFSDVPATHWGYADIEAAAAAGLMRGTGEGIFSPEAEVSAAQFLTLLGRLVFPEVKAEGADWSGPYIAAAQEAGLLDGTQLDLDNAQGQIDRYDMAVILRSAAKKLGVIEQKARSGEVADYVDIPVRYADAVLAVYGMGLIKGDQNRSFNGGSTMTRTEVATVIMRLSKAADEARAALEEPAPTPKPQETASSDPQGAREAVIQGLINMDREINVEAYHLRPEEFSALFSEVVEADPDRYFVFSYLADINFRKNEAKSMTVHYLGTKEQYKAYKRDMKAAKAKAEEIVATTVHDGMSDYDIAKALHDYLVLNVEYDHNWIADIYDPNAKTGPGDYALYFPLIEGSAVCSGYTYAYKYLMDLAGVPCEEIDGDSTGTDQIAAALGYRWSVGHAWNIVQIDGEWYHVDVTWDDLGGDRIRYDYFLKSDQAMSGHSDWDSPHPCTSTKYDGAADDMNKERQVTEAALQEAQWAAERAVLTAQFLERFNATLPYRSEEGLTGTDGLSDEELLSYLNDKVYYPMDEYTYEEMMELYFAVANSPDEEVFQLNGQFMDNSYEDGQWYLEVWRWDIWREYERRHADDPAQ